MPRLFKKFLNNLNDKFIFGTTTAYSKNNIGGTQFSFDKHIEFAVAVHDGNDSSINIITAAMFTNFSEGKVGFKSTYFESCSCYYFIKFK